jgi:hypothetical protein
MRPIYSVCKACRIKAGVKPEDFDYSWSVDVVHCKPIGGQSGTSFNFKADFLKKYRRCPQNKEHKKLQRTQLTPNIDVCRQCVLKIIPPCSTIDEWEESFKRGRLRYCPRTMFVEIGVKTIDLLEGLCICPFATEHVVAYEGNHEAK